MGCQRHFNMPGADAEPGLRQSEDSDGPVPLGCPPDFQVATTTL